MDPFDLQRFVDAQERTHERAVAELRSGAKRSHWMWFVFPQLAGLGSSAMARRYAIRSLDEAVAYGEHPVLGPRLREATAAALASGVSDPRRLFGAPDDMKFRSSMTLFARAAPAEPLFGRALQRFCGGEQDGRTLELLGRGFDRSEND